MIYNSYPTEYSTFDFWSSTYILFCYPQKQIPELNGSEDLIFDLRNFIDIHIFENKEWDFAF